MGTCHDHVIENVDRISANGPVGHHGADWALLSQVVKLDARIPASCHQQISICWMVLQAGDYIGVIWHFHAPWHRQFLLACHDVVRVNVVVSSGDSKILAITRVIGSCDFVVCSLVEVDPRNRNLVTWKPALNETVRLD